MSNHPPTFLFQPGPIPSRHDSRCKRMGLMSVAYMCFRLQLFEFWVTTVFAAAGHTIYREISTLTKVVVLTLPFFQEISVLCPFNTGHLYLMLQNRTHSLPSNLNTDISSDLPFPFLFFQEFSVLSVSLPWDNRT